MRGWGNLSMEVRLAERLWLRGLLRGELVEVGSSRGERTGNCVSDSWEGRGEGRRGEFEWESLGSLS